MSIGFAGFIEPINFIGYVGSSDIDPAFIVTHNGDSVKNNGALVTLGTNIDPALIVMHESRIVTESGRIITNGA